MVDKYKDPNFVSLHADPDAWNFKSICDDCVNKDGGSCYIFGEGGEAPDPRGRLEAQSTGKCEWYIKKSQIKEKSHVRLFNEVQRMYIELVNSDERRSVLLCYFQEQLRELLKLYDEIILSNSTLSQRLANDIKRFVHNDMDISFFGGYKEVFCNIAEEYTAIEAVYELVDEFRYTYPIEEREKPHQKAYKPVQGQKGYSVELIADEAKTILDAAVNAGLCSKIPGTDLYNWMESARLLVYFILKANTELRYYSEVTNSKDDSTEIRQEWNKWRVITQIKGKSFENKKLTEIYSGVKTKNGVYKHPTRANKVDEAYSWTKDSLKL